MTEVKKPKKNRLFKYAAEFNISTDSILNFLKEKGYKVKSHMSILSEDMISDINIAFKKDIELSEKHYKRVSDFRKKHGREEKVEKEEPTKIVEETKQPEVETVKEIEPENVQPEEKEEIVEHEDEVIKEEDVETGDDEPKEEKIDAAVIEDSKADTIEDTEALDIEELEESEGEIEKAGNDKPYRTQAEIDISNKKTGLKVLGKIDISSKKKNKSKSKSKQKTDKEDPSAKPEHGDVKKKKKVLKRKKKSHESDSEHVKGKKKRRIKRLEVDKKEVEAAIKRTLQSMGGSSSLDERSHARKKKRIEKNIVQEQIQHEKEEHDKTTIKVTEFVSVNELANLMNVPVSEVIQKCIGFGLMVSINQRLEAETILLVADEFGFDVEFQKEFEEDILQDAEDDESTLVPRPPVVTIMGHVDHGKTSLLDFIRNENVVAGEAGGITQHIGAYSVELKDKRRITFLDTPGHEAFTAMRARGARVTDIVVLIVAADDAVMPQTVEAINHSLAAEVPIVVAINKIDKPGANPEKIKQQLADRNILVEDWGGKYQAVEISAKKGTNVDVLLEKILLEAEMLELKANPDRLARGTVIEALLDKGRGVTSTILVQKGTLKIGDPFVAGIYQGKVRAMFDVRNNKINNVPPSRPAVVLGFEGVPQAGDDFVVVESERIAREVSLKRQQLKRELDNRQVKHLTLDEIANQISMGGIRELPIVIKGDVDGSVEALSDSFMKLSTEKVVVNVIHKGVGAITEGDVLLAAASQAVIVGFHVRPNLNAKRTAEKEKVDIRIYNVIYDAINEIKSALEGLLAPIVSEETTATIEVREIFKVPKVGTIAGCYVQDGKVTRSSKIRLYRDGVVIYTGELDSLKRFKDDVKEVDAGYECGLNIAGYNDIKVGDIIESYKMIETKQKLQ